MSGIRLTVRTDTTAEARLQIDAAARLAFPSDDGGLVWINAGTDGQQLAEQVASVVWQANGGYCELAIEIDWSAAMPGGDVEAFSFGRENYERRSKGTSSEDSEQGVYEHGSRKEQQQQQ